MTGQNQHIQGAIRNWKAIQLDYDNTIVNSSDSFSLYCLSETQAEALRAIIQTQAWTTRWFSPTNTAIVQDEIDTFTSEVITRLMDGCGCGEDTIPRRFRFTADGGYEMSIDGGDTWIDASEYDYRNISVLSPPLVDQGITNTKCQAADSVVVTLRDEIITQMTEGTGAAAILALIAAVLLVFLTAGSALIIASMPGIAGAIIGVGVAAMQAAFTETVWNDFRCLVYCRMDSDDSISEENFPLLLQDVHDSFEGIVNIVLTNLINAAGTVGLTNMMRSATGDPEADCDECGCGDCQEIEIDYAGFATLIDYDSETCIYTLQSVAEGDHWVMGLDVIEGGEQGCAYCTLYGVVSGNIGRPFPFNYKVCGEGSERSNQSVSPINFCVDYAYIISNEQLVVEVRFEACP